MITLIEPSFSGGLSGVYRNIQGMAIFTVFLLVVNSTGIFIPKKKESVTTINLHT
jgi:hypothetical protein